jgi:hypothetical protein
MTFSEYVGGLFRLAVEPLAVWKNRIGRDMMRRSIYFLIAVALAFPALSAAAVTGKVINTRGRPIAGAEIYSESRNTPQMRTFRTDAKGEFTTADPESGARKMSFTIAVADKDGKAVAKASVSVPWPSETKPGSKVIRTDRRGRFTLPDTDGNAVGWFGIRVRDSSGKPVPRALLTVRDNSGRGSGPAITMNDNGEMTYGDYRRGDRSRTIVATAKGFSYASAEWKPGGEMPVITLRPESKFVGRVITETGKPAQGSTVAVENISARGSNGRYFDVEGWLLGRRNICEVITGKDGRFVLHHLPRPADYTHGSVSISLSGKGKARVNNYISLKDLNKPLTITHPSGCSVQGVLFLPGKTGPAPATTSIGVQTFNKGGSRTRFVSLDKNGRFSISELPPGKADVILQTEQDFGPDGRPVQKPREWTMPATSVTLKAGKTETLELVAVVGAQIKGIVRDKASGKPLAKASVQVQDASRIENYGEGLTTDENGAFTTRVCPGKVSVLVSRLGQTDNSIYFDCEEPPSVTFDAVDGQDKTDVVVDVDPTESRQLAYSMGNKKVPYDFELKPGTYDLTWDPNMAIVDGNWLGGQAGWNQAKKNIAKLPVLKSKKPAYYSVRLDGDGKEGLLCIVLDESGGPGKGYDTAYIDTNRNFDLSDETPVTWLPRNGNSSAPWVAVQAHQGPAGGEHADNPINIRLMLYGKNASDVSLQRKGAWTCPVSCNKGDVQFALADINNNGIYGEKTKLNDARDPSSIQNGDCAFVDAVGMGRVVLYEYGPDTMKLSNAVKLANRFYKVDANPIGNKVTIAPYDGPVGSLFVRADSVNGMKGVLTSLTVIGSAGDYSFENCKGPISLPAGNYKVAGCNIGLTSKGVAKFQLGCSLNAPAKVTAGKQTTIPIAGRLRMAINPEKKIWYLKPGSAADVNWNIKIGQNITVESLGNSDKEPTVKFYNKAGKLIHTTTAGYT